MKFLNGSELAGFIKERQARQIRALVVLGVRPQLAIVRTNPDPVVDSYMKLKQNYGSDIGAEVVIHTIQQAEALKTIKELNKDKNTNGIIVQIPLPDDSQTDEILNAVAANKDVDGLAQKTDFHPATPLAISWLLAGYNCDLKDKKILIIGQGRLVGKPLKKLWEKSNYEVSVADKNTKELKSLTQKADVIISATGKPGLIKSEMIKEGAVLVDAGVATDKNGLIGDVDPEIRKRDDLIITPEKGGVGPLTVSALFENLIEAAGK